MMMAATTTTHALTAHQMGFHALYALLLVAAIASGAIADDDDGGDVDLGVFSPPAPTLDGLRLQLDTADEAIASAEDDMHAAEARKFQDTEEHDEDDEDDAENAAIAESHAKTLVRLKEWRHELDQARRTYRAANELADTADDDDSAADDDESTTSPSAHHPRGLSPLVRAAKAGQLDQVKALIEGGADVNDAHGGTGTTPLLMAAREGEAGVVALLLSKGADVAAKDSDGSTALLLAAIRGHVDVAKRLVEHWQGKDARLNEDTLGTFVDATDTRGYGAVHIGSFFCQNPAFVAYVLEHSRLGVDARAATEKRPTPLLLAAKAGQARCARLLLERGANPRLLTFGAKSAVDLAEEMGHAALASEVLRPAMAAAEAEYKEKMGLMDVHLHEDL